MKQNVGISWFSIRLKLPILLFFIPQLLSAQEYNDSIRISYDSISIKPEGILQYSTPELFPEKNTALPLSPSYQPERIPRFSLRGNIYIPYQTNPSPLFRGDYRTNGILHQFDHGVVFGSGGQTSLPGIGRFNDATLSYRHLFNDKLSFQLDANAMKINMSHITGAAFSTSGTLLYRTSDRVAFKLFGSYDIGNSYGMSTNRYGATMSVDMSDRFGLEMGVQRYYDAMSGRWETVPVMIPYYRFEKFTLGLDVGGIIYEILRDAVFDKNRGMSSPTIGPPRLHIPIR